MNKNIATLINSITENVSKLKDEKGCLDLRQSNVDLTFKGVDRDVDGETEIELNAYLLSQDKNNVVYVSTGPRECPMSEDDETLEELVEDLRTFGAKSREVEAFLQSILKALEEIKLTD